MDSTSKVRTERVVFQPTVRRTLQRGIDRMVSAIRPTLGPQPRFVAIDRAPDGRMPELLDNGAVIAKRIVQLTNRDEDMGAMLIRDVLWQLHEQVGDGTATAAVLFQSIYDQGVQYLSTSGNAMRLRFFLEQGAQAILAHLTGMSVHISGQEKLTHIAQTICYESPLAKMLGEIFDIVGEYGRVEVRAGRTRNLEREYVEGMYWESGLLARELVTDYNLLRSGLENAAVLITDLEINTIQQLLPVLELAINSKIPALMIVANKISTEPLALLLANKKSEKLKVIAVKTPGWGGWDVLEDLAVLTGGSPYIKAAGHKLEHIKREDFGYARRVWADMRNFGIVGGKGNPRALRQHIATLRASYEQAEDKSLRGTLLNRIGKLMGGSATLWIGGTTELEITTRKELAERTVSAMRATIMEGVLPGGGSALLACRNALQTRLNQSDDDDERAAYRILLRTMEIPIRTISANSGHDPNEVMAKIKMAEEGYGFDAVSGQIVHMTQTGIWDAAVVQKSAVNAAITSAAQALTIDVLIHHKERPIRPAARPPLVQRRRR